MTSTSFTAIFVFVIVGMGISLGSLDLNLRPIIGVLTQRPPPDTIAHLPDQNYTSFVDACYVKYLESAGARVVPIFINQDDSYYERIASSVNGILFPGGTTSLTNSSGYGMAGQKLYDLAEEAYRRGQPLPVWGTCLGQEMIIYLAAQQTDWRTPCHAEDKADPLTLQPDHVESRLFTEMPDYINDILSYQNATANFHQFCSTPEGFYSSGVSEDYRLLATSFDYDGLEYVSLVEHKEIPIFASQFHPEMVPFQWSETPEGLNIPHDAMAVEASQYLASFFVQQARQNNNSFQSEDEEQESLIYNYQKTFTGKFKDFYTEIYLFW